MKGWILVLMIQYIPDLMLKKWYEWLHIMLYIPNEINESIGIGGIQLNSTQNLIKSLSMLMRVLNKIP